jgi:hypothetical protein
MTAKKDDHSASIGKGDHAEDHLGAVEGDRPTDPNQGNRNAPGVDSEGQPNDPIKICEDVIGANADETEG